MTDGPYAPLSMSRQWNEFGRALVRPAFEKEAAPCLRRAVLGDARREHVGELAAFLKDALRHSEPDLFEDGRQAALDAARERFTAPMAQSALDHCEGALREGDDADAAVDKGVAACLRERARDSSHTIEAHLLREEGVATANEAQTRFEALLPQTHWGALAQEAQNGVRPEANDNARPTDRLEDGPPMRRP
ncbi:MAG: hypothetical protein HXY22_01960 [Alphaproteobacteria bacterium]|nr:hypothetical protein [Alphaproteobacteria bacterium]